jgi:hypothetical protein
MFYVTTLHQLLEYYNQLSLQNDLCTYIYHPRFDDDDDDTHVTGKVVNSCVPKKDVKWRCGYLIWFSFSHP